MGWYSDYVLGVVTVSTSVPTRDQFLTWINMQQQKYKRKDAKVKDVDIETIYCTTADGKTCRLDKHCGLGNLQIWASASVPGESVEALFTNAPAGKQFVITTQTKYGGFEDLAFLAAAIQRFVPCTFVAGYFSPDGGDCDFPPPTLLKPHFYLSPPIEGKEATSSEKKTVKVVSRSSTVLKSAAQTVAARTGTASLATTVSTASVTDNKASDKRTSPEPNIGTLSPTSVTTRPTPATTRPTPATTRPTPATTRPTPATTRPTPATTRPTPATTRPSLITAKKRKVAAVPSDIVFCDNRTRTIALDTRDHLPDEKRTVLVDFLAALHEWGTLPPHVMADIRLCAADFASDPFFTETSEDSSSH